MVTFIARFLKTFIKPVMALVLTVFFTPAFAQNSEPGFAVRGGLGTDLSLGIAAGGGIRFYTHLQGITLEYGPDFYYHSSEETTNNGFNDYTESTVLLVFAARINVLNNFYPSQKSFYYFYGVGLAGISIDWTESSPTDTSLGTLLPGGGSKQSASGTVVASILSIGIGQFVTEQLDLRFETNLLYSFSGIGGYTVILPTFVFSAGYSF